MGPCFIVIFHRDHFHSHFAFSIFYRINSVFSCHTVMWFVGVHRICLLCGVLCEGAFLNRTSQTSLEEESSLS